MIVGRMSAVRMHIRRSTKRISWTYDTAFRVLTCGPLSVTCRDEVRDDGTSPCTSSGFTATRLGASVTADATASRLVTTSFSTRPVTTSCSIEMLFASSITGSVWVELSTSDTADSAALGPVTTSSSSRSATISLTRDTSSVSSAPDSGDASEKTSLI